MLKIGEAYSINNGQGSIVFTEGNKGTVNALYNITGNKSEGKINGTLDGNVLKGTFHVDAAAGLIEFTFTEDGFNAKWKQGIEPGPMRGKWVGLIKQSLINNSIIETNYVSLYDLCFDFKDEKLLKLDDLLSELVLKGTFQGEKYNFTLTQIIEQVNRTYGELSWNSVSGSLKEINTLEYYSVKWGELLEVLKNKASLSQEFRVLGDFIHLEYQPFSDGEKAMEFAETVYYKGIDLAKSFDEITWFTSATLNGEYYSNEQLITAAGNKAIQLVEEPDDYIRVCFDDDSNLVYNEEIMKEAIENIKGLKDEIDSDLLSFLKDDLANNDFDDLLED